jgi:hypothetical protein
VSTSVGRRRTQPDGRAAIQIARHAQIWTWHMAVEQRQTNPQPETRPSGCLPLVLRVFWMAFGNIALVLCAAFVSKGTAPVVADIAFFSVAISLIVVRYVDIALFAGDTAEGKPATIADWRRYALKLAVISSALWALARIAASHGWM